MKPFARFSALSLATSLVLAGCATSESSPVPETPPLDSASPSLSIVVSTTVLGSIATDIAQCAAGQDTTVTVVMPVGVDPHDFQPSSAQVAAMVSADLVIVNGLGLEEGLLPAVEGIGADGARVLDIGELIDPLPFGAEASPYTEDDGHGHGEAAGEEEESGHGTYDPHFWMDMERMALAATLIGEEIESLGGKGSAACGEEVAATIATAQEGVVDILSGIPESRRVLVTDHDALSYFAESFGFTVIGVVIPGGSTLGEPDSQELAALVRVIQDQDVSAIFGDATLSNQILEVLASEAGRDVVVVSLFIGSLGGPDSGATSYIEMMTTNAERIAQALAD